MTNIQMMAKASRDNLGTIISNAEETKRYLEEMSDGYESVFKGKKGTDLHNNIKNILGDIRSINIAVEKIYKIIPKKEE